VVGKPKKEGSHKLAIYGNLGHVFLSYKEQSRNQERITEKVHCDRKKEKAAGVTKKRSANQQRGETEPFLLTLVGR